jgi:3-deoxy-D-manno-octulosonic-acid transferase
VIPGRWPFRMGGQFHRRAWSVLSLILVQTESSVAALSDHGLAAEATGDPRFDRVLQSVEAHEADAALERWVNNRPCLVAGSAWAPECEAAREAWIPGRCAVVVPHEWTESWVASESKKWEEAGARPVVWSVERGDDARTELSEADVLIVDTVGELLGLYAVADVALVGGGFGAGVHNTLEPAAYGAFILVGPQVGRFREVKELQRAGGLQVCADRKELVNRLHAVWNANLEVAESGARAQAYARSNQGAGERIARAWEKRLEGEGSSHDLG